MPLKFFLTTIFVLFLTTTYQITDGFDDQLILFVSNENKTVDAAYLKEFKAFAKKNESVAVIKTIEEDGVPSYVTVTPTIVYQDVKGHSIYYGRYRNFSRMKTFVRKSRLLHSQNSSTPKKEILVWKNQRASITAPLKVTPISGTVPGNVDPTIFKQTANSCFAKGMQHFELLPEFDQPKTNRAFYIDIHPHLSEDQTLTLTGEIYSQFNCIRSVYASMKTPIVQGKWKKRRQLLATAASLLEAQILNVITQSEKGDDFVPVPLATKNKDVPMDLAGSATKQNTSPLSETVPGHWKVKQQANSHVPVGAFSFLSPLDGYAGEIKQLNGSLTLNEQKGLYGAKGRFAVAIKDITMGERGFDQEVQYKMLNIEQFPEATFVFDRVTEVSNQLKLYREEECTVRGIFTMKGYEIPLTVPATMELRLDKEGRYLLHTVAVFSLDLFDDFKVEGPDGPSPAKDVLDFVLKFDLESADN